MISIETFDDLLECQKDFQKRLGNKLPENTVDFTQVQTSLSHNIYQQIELQEFIEAETRKEKQEELIDYLLFMLNKYIYLGINLDGDQSILGTLWSTNSSNSEWTIDSLAKIEQSNYISFIRKWCIFKPWKVRVDTDCVADKVALRYLFFTALDSFRQMSNIMFDTYDEFKQMLMKKLQVNIDRQNFNY